MIGFVPLPMPRSATLASVSGPADRQLLPRLGLVEATLVVMGGIVGSGIFINPSVVARHVHSGPLILGAWLVGGAVALVGAFIYAELAERMPRVGGQYAYLREAFHPVVGFLYGWALLVVINAGGTAAVAVTFGRYAVELTGSALDEKLIAVLTLVVLAGINCLGVKSGSLVQGGLMVLKIGVLLTLIVLGLLLGHAAAPVRGRAPRRPARVRRGDGSGPLRLRRLADRELHRRGGAGAAPQPPPRARRRRHRRGRPLSRGATGSISGASGPRGSPPPAPRRRA